VKCGLHQYDVGDVDSIGDGDDNRDDAERDPPGFILWLLWLLIIRSLDTVSNLFEFNILTEFDVECISIGWPDWLPRRSLFRMNGFAPFCRATEEGFDEMLVILFNRVDFGKSKPLKSLEDGKGNEKDDEEDKFDDELSCSLADPFEAVKGW